MAAPRTLPLLVLVSAVVSATGACAAPASADARDAPGLGVSLLGGYRRSSQGSRAAAAMLLVTFALDRRARQPPGARDASAALEPPRRASAQGASALREAPGAAGDGEPARRRIVLPVTPQLARAVVGAALRASRAGSADLDAAASRARSSAVLPEVRLRGGRSTDDTLRLTPTLDDPYRYTQAGGESLFLEARLGWRLDRLVFADEEAPLERLRQSRASEAARLSARVLEALFAWQRALVRQSDPELQDAERVLATLAAAEAEATLDVLTDGWWSQWRSAGSRRRGRRAAAPRAAR